MTSILYSLAVSPPNVSLSEAQTVAQKHFNVGGHCKPLGGERDRNFLIERAEGNCLLKISNVSEEDQILDMQCKALAHIELHSPELPTPRLIRTSDGKDWATFVNEAGEAMRARLLTFLPGTPIGQAAEDSHLMQNVGRSVAKLNRALHGFMHSAAQHELAWDTQRLDQLEPLLIHMDSAAEKQLVQTTLDRFKQFVKPQLAGCRSQVIHNDVTYHNTVVSHEDPTQISGMFDFGDMVYAPLIQDLSHPAAELPAGCRDPLARSVEIVAGFHAVTPLEDAEFKLLPDLIASRLAACILLEAWAASEVEWEDDRDHLDGWHDKSVSMLSDIQSAEPDHFENLIRSACGEPVVHNDSICNNSTLGSTAGVNINSAADTAWQSRQQTLGNANYIAYDKPLHLVKGAGVWLEDSQSNRYLDVYNNVPHAGHCHPRVTQAIVKQTALLNTNTRYMVDVVTEYAEKILSTLPDELDTCYFVSSGSEANDLAWRLSTAWTGNRGGLVMDNAYHGITEATYALSPAESKLGKHQFAHIGLFAAPDDYRGEYKRDDPSRGQHFAQYISGAINDLAARNYQPAAFFIDSIMSSNGVFTPPKGYLENAYDIVRAAGGLCVADEVQSGFGRTGKHLWGFQFGETAPDIVTFGKPIAGGYPMGVVVTRKEIAQKFESQGDFFSTTGGNPVACAAALAMLGVIENERLMENADTVGESMMKELRDMAKQYPVIGDVRGSGLFIGVELIKDRDTLEPATIETKQLANKLREHGVLTGLDGNFQNVLKVRPPMVFTQQHAEIFLKTMRRALTELDQVEVD
ncbi:MAG: 4-aminobutyrate aminotransferase-like enzyme/Ser/Thr protein kinase RdoA (MazF antagonist) [Saprospiraceae bacterium]